MPKHREKTTVRPMLINQYILMNKIILACRRSEVVNFDVFRVKTQSLFIVVAHVVSHSVLHVAILQERIVL